MIKITGKNLGLTEIRGRAMTVKELSALLRTSERWLKIHMHDGIFPFPWYRIGSKTRIVDSADVDAWLARIKVPAGSAPLPTRTKKKSKKRR